MSNHKKKIWEFAFGLLKVDDLVPSQELIELAEKEVRGEISKKKIIEILKEKYDNKKRSK